MRLVVAAAALAALGLAAGCSGDEGRSAGPTLATNRSLTPRAHLFGELVHARFDVIVDRAEFDPDRVRVRLDFLPYRIKTGLQRSRVDFARVTRLRWEATLRCITIACVPSRVATTLGAQEGRGERRTYRFRPAQVVYDDPRTGKARPLKRVFWQPLAAISRLSPDDERVRFGAEPGAEFQSTLAPLPAATQRLPPRLLAGVLVALAVGLLALPGTVAARAVRRRGPLSGGVPASPLDLALARVERARDDGDVTAQRAALEALAHELDGDGTAARARALAWKPHPPPRMAVTALVDDVRSSDGAAG